VPGPGPLAPGQPGPGQAATLDLLAVALAVFFVALIAIVAALLILPTLGR